MLRDIYNLFAGTPIYDSFDVESHSEETSDAREAGSRFSRGNIPMQGSEFVTTQGLELERADAIANPL